MIVRVWNKEIQTLATALAISATATATQDSPCAFPVPLASLPVHSDFPERLDTDICSQIMIKLETGSLRIFASLPRESMR